MGGEADFMQQMKATKSEVDTALVEYFQQADMSKFSKRGKEAWRHLRDFSERPGKRIRGSLVLRSYDMFGGDNREQAMKAAVAVELIQNYLLIVDDVMDRSPIRRGKPSVQHLYYESLKPIAGDDTTHLGDMLAINVGLVTAHAASKLMTEIAVEPEIVVRANRVFHENIMTTGYGQIDDLYSGLGQTSEEEVMMTHEFKSSYYTFINPMQMGAILAGATDEQCEELADFGRSAGIAFQLQDDIIGLFGVTDDTGKSYLDDLKEGKHTLIIQQAFERANKKDALIISEALGNHNIGEQQAAIVRNIIIDCGAREYADKAARKYAAQAIDVVDASAWPEEHKEFLKGLMNYIVERLN